MPLLPSPPAANPNIPGAGQNPPTGSLQNPSGPTISSPPTIGGVPSNLINSKVATTADSGWYVMIAAITGVLLSNTQVAPIAIGILTVSLLYQLNLMLNHQ